jgi:hypothetical protein
MHMTESKMTRLFSRSTLREVLIVVVGIMIAFSLDAWWDRSSSTASLRDQAALVLDELRATESAFESSIDNHQRLLDTAQFLVEQLNSVSRGGEIIVADTTIAALMVQFTVDVGTPSLESFLESGGSGLISDPEDRAMLRSWPTSIEDKIDDQVFLRDNYTVSLADFLRQNFDLGESEVTSHTYRASLHFNAPEMREHLRFEQIQLRSETELLNLLNARVAMEKFMTLTLEEVLDINRELITIVEEI